MREVRFQRALFGRDLSATTLPGLMYKRAGKKVQELCERRTVGLSQEISVRKDGKQIVETAVEARGGRLGRPVLLVLLVSCVLAVAALIFTYSGT